MSRRLTVGPFNRVEGDLEVKLEIDDGQVNAAYVNSTLYRGFEQILAGKDPLDAMTITPRICGICSVAQSMASAHAIQDAMGLVPTDNGRISQNLILACENVADHLTHFYLFFMPDFARKVYEKKPWYGDVYERFRAMEGSCANQFLPVRARFMQLLGTMAGKWPHTLAIQPGGTTRAIGSGERVQLKNLLIEFRAFLEETLFGAPLESVVELQSIRDLDFWMGQSDKGDFRRFLNVADDLNLKSLGRATDRFLSYGAYVQADGHYFGQGVWDGEVKPLDAGSISEDLTHAWLAGSDDPVSPLEGSTQPFIEKEAAYSWCKAPRLGGSIVETGALARQQVAGHALIRELVAADGGNVRNRVIARMLEVARLIPAMEQWLDELELGEPFCSQGELPVESQGMGLIEAARGSLGHWLVVKDGCIANYQIIAPTTWNFSPRDGEGNPGALEQALQNTPVEEGDENPVSVQHVVRSFDPCMVCTVH